MYNNCDSHVTVICPQESQILTKMPHLDHFWLIEYIAVYTDRNNTSLSCRKKAMKLKQVKYLIPDDYLRTRSE